MATPSVGQRDKQGRYWTGTGWKSLEQVMKSQQTSPGRTGERTILPGVGEIQYTGSKYGWQTKSTVKSRQSAQPDPEPVKPKDSRLDSPVAGPGPKGNEVGSRVRAVPVIPAPAATSTATTTPAPAATTQRPTQTQRPTRTQRPAEPKVSPSKPAQTGDRTKDLTTWALANKSMIDKVGTKSQREILTKAQTGGTMPAPRPLKASYEYDAYDLVVEYLLSQGHVDTLEEAHYVMMEMDAEMIGDIVEDGFNSSGRYDVGGGRTVGPVAGAIRSLVTGNLPKSKTYVPPSKQTATNSPPATPASKGDSGKLSDFGAGGGRAKLKQGMTVGQVERQGRMNRGDYSG
jgi:hypothetical protein